ncbi:craniofacial development protein 2 [Bemisia tabaci]|uniref:craniofacial development protein 2 n=1 Tax=Bemisia tabaci TaxID=7038 RepID=UPI0008F99B30|nr:PREDICTED: craniofacial development protein 2-like [Bemisia tabaci]
MTVLEVYGVNDDSTVAVKDQFFEELDEEIENIGHSREIVVLGDLNGRTGRQLNSKIVGPFGEATLNDNGNRIIDVCEQRGLKVLNGFYQHKDIHKFTWVQPTRGLQSVIDYVIVKQDTSLKVQQVRVWRGLSCGSDHYFLGAAI